VTPTIALFALAAVLAQAPPPATAPTVPPILWPKEPTAYRGIAFASGTVEAAKKTIPGLDCSKLRRGLTCTSSFQVGGVSVQDRWRFLGDGLVEVWWKFDSNDYEQLRAVFIDKYGPPTRRSNADPVKCENAILPNERLDWGPGTLVWIHISQFVGKSCLDSGSATFMSKAYGKQFDKEVEEERKKGKEAF
jgi:hypothetical protein